MDSLSQLALMAKAKLVFESPGTFLSFPALYPLSYAPDQLDFSQLSGQSTPVFPEFCQLANAIPQGVLYPASMSSFLWDIYDYVLRNAETAQSTLTPQEAAGLQQAMAFLYAQAPGGTRTDSPAVVAYNQYRQAWLQAMQDYASQKSTAGASTDPGAQAQWQNVDEPRLRAQVQAAEAAWETEGFKAQVEQAQGVEQACAAKSPVLQWKTWRDAFNPDIDVQTSATGVSYAPTTYSPFDVLDQPGWPTFTLTGAEIGQLADEAPPELRNIFDLGTAASSVSSLSFEFCSVTLNRYWFHPDVFSARFWRLPDPSVQLSDGMVPPQGECPGYISAVVFARNIVVTESSGTGPAPPKPLPVFPPIMLRPGFVLVTPARTIVPLPTRTVVPVPPRTFVPAGTVRETAGAGTAVRLAAIAPAAAEPQLSPAAAVAIPPRVVDRMNLGTFRTLPIAPVGSPPAPPGTEPAPSPVPPSPAPSGGGQPQPPGNVSILAFICKPLPRCPDPDPALDWGP